ncbi:hypothetical protein [Mucilaginibacter sp. FT3.2]|uniref:hypothetical protein n=1 Tax=Mucilaginibacter sp. FT3.2 TaxID=2723090 RepID=UPI00160C6111|nr:hypothetical protein [Mucilaginibacter sp. FT3.2]MBB6230935.1 hypothetical protein [Mucilaginibacter sp. FT3.2]
MNYLPYDNFYIDTPLKPEQVQYKLKKEVAPRRTSFSIFGNSKSNFYFKGIVKKDRFAFQPDITGLASFNPQIKGSISVYRNGSRVFIKMALNPWFSVCMCIALILLLAAELAIVISKTNKEKFGLPDLPLLLMLACIYLFATLAYKFESSATKTRLVGLLNGRLTDVK